MFPFSAKAHVICHHSSLLAMARLCYTVNAIAADGRISVEMALTWWFSWNIPISAANGLIRMYLIATTPHIQHACTKHTACPVKIYYNFVRTHGCNRKSALRLLWSYLLSCTSAVALLLTCQQYEVKLPVLTKRRNAFPRFNGEVPSGDTALDDNGPEYLRGKCQNDKSD